MEHHQVAVYPSKKLTVNKRSQMLGDAYAVMWKLCQDLDLDSDRADRLATAFENLMRDQR